MPKITWAIPAGNVQDIRQAWTMAPEGSEHLAEGFIEMENFDGHIKRMFIRVFEDRTEIDHIPISQSFWTVADWDIEREYNQEGDVVFFVKRTDLDFDVEILYGVENVKT